MRHASSFHVTWRIHICDMTPPYMRHDSYICVTWLIYIDSSIRVTWLIIFVTWRDVMWLPYARRARCILCSRRSGTREVALGSEILVGEAAVAEKSHVKMNISTNTGNIYICANLCVYIYVHMYIYIYIYMYTEMYMYVYIYKYINMHICMSIYIRIYMYIHLFESCHTHAWAMHMNESCQQKCVVHMNEWFHTHEWAIQMCTHVYEWFISQWYLN